jgi:hypothetical protein
MAMPSILKLAHALHGHKDIRCHKESRLHFHSAEFDSEFQKFNKTTVFFHQPLILEIAAADLAFTQPQVTLPLVFNSTPLPFSLRAPPITY